jgi:hypothetical protein
MVWAAQERNGDKGEMRKLNTSLRDCRHSVIRFDLDVHFPNPGTPAIALQRIICEPRMAAI